ncbi:hypothetical protein DW981_10135 [Clostridium sp. AM49-4BH]|nr:hypothetical protein DW981_10135 [Clostridium sp. AM49-4BH]
MPSAGFTAFGTSVLIMSTMDMFVVNLIPSFFFAAAVFSAFAASSSLKFILISFLLIACLM